jgi:hypothetical protein
VGFSEKDDLHPEAMTNLAQHSEGRICIATVAKILVKLTNNYQCHRDNCSTFEHG